MKLETKLVNMHYDFKQKGTKFEFFSFGDITPYLEEFLEKKVNLELRKTSTRSLTANGYLWHLLGELQEKLRIPKEEIYRHYIVSIGSYDVYCMKECAVEAFIKYWNDKGLGWIADPDKSKIDGCVNVIAYKGTSEYTKEEMAVLLGQVVEDAIDQGIPTKRKEDIDSLIKEWKQ